MSIPHPTPTRHTPSIRGIERAIPPQTPVATLRNLDRRYENEQDAAIAALPSFYREAVLVRVHHLLASAPKELPQ